MMLNYNNEISLSFYSSHLPLDDTVWDINAKYKTGCWFVNRFNVLLEWYLSITSYAPPVNDKDNIVFTAN